MQLINHTHWRSDHLRAIIDRVALEELSPQQCKTVVIHITYGSRRSGSSGHTYSGGSGLVKHDGKWVPYRVRLCVSSQEIDRVDFAGMAAHEFAHVRGMGHRDMRTPRYRRIGNYRELYAWAEGLPLEGTATRPRVPWTVKGQEEFDHAVWMSYQWQQRADRAQRPGRADRAQRLARKWGRQARVLQVRLVKATVRYRG